MGRVWTLGPDVQECKEVGWLKIDYCVASEIGELVCATGVLVLFHSFFVPLVGPERLIGICENYIR